MQPARRIEDRAGVLARPADHRPARPGWTCTAGCGDWPCERYRNHLLATLDRSAILSLMATHYCVALAELAAEPQVVHDRLFAWFRHADARRPAGGPW